MSRPRTLALTTMRRLPSSRLTWLGPGAVSNVATADSGTKPMRPSAPRGRAMGRRLRACRSLRTASGRRTWMSKRRSPWNTVPASVPPMAVLMASCTSPMFRP